MACDRNVIDERSRLHDPQESDVLQSTAVMAEDEA